MQFRFKPTSAAVLLVLSSIAYAQTGTRPGFSLQVGSFADVPRAAEFATKLIASGERVRLVSVDLGVKGRWVRVLLDMFTDSRIAYARGEQLMRRKLIPGFLIVPAHDPAYQEVPLDPEAVSSTTSLRPVVQHISHKVVFAKNASTPQVPTARLPESNTSPAVLALYRTYDLTHLPFSDSMTATINLLAGYSRRNRDSYGGGLWVGGSISEARRRLEWIAGSGADNLVQIKEDGKVELNWAALMRRAGVRDAAQSDSALTLASYIAADEGLLLLVQVTCSSHRYRLFLGSWVPTQAGSVHINGGINLDRNYDSRINPYRRTGKKLDTELPPIGFDSLIALNPEAHWLNLDTNSLVPQGNITFHELAEAHAKVELGLDYLQLGNMPGAHEVAIGREVRLKASRPGYPIVVTAGPNRILKTPEEFKDLSVHTDGAPRR
ncbi:MAG TPA: SPOR domain-containing protein [Blastocatellia bacterium]|nr:SPOR domain-containing protein [Blastocatellia bacterium]